MATFTSSPTRVTTGTSSPSAEYLQVLWTATLGGRTTDEASRPAAKKKAPRTYTTQACKPPGQPSRKGSGSAFRKAIAWQVATSVSSSSVTVI